MIKKRIILISLIAVLFIVMLCAYLFVVAPMLEENEESTSKIELLDGEVWATSTTILMFDHVERANIQSIEISNKNNNYKFYYDEAKKDFFIEGYENAPYSKEMIATLISNAGYPVTMKRVVDKTDDLSQYGLAESDNPAYYILTTRKGETYKVYIGNMIPTGAGYYTRYEERDAVYITEASISQTLLGKIENLITPMLFIPTTQSDYFLVKDLILVKEEKPFIEVTTETKEAQTSEGKKYEEFVDYKMLYPAEYTVSTNYDVMLQGFMELYGNSVLELCKDGEVFSDDILEKYNLKTPAYELLFTHNGIMNDIFISKKTEDGVYYAYSLLFNIICDIPADLFNFLEWELIEYIEKPLFQYNINDIDSITVTSKDFNETFVLYTEEGETTTNPVTGATTTKTELKVKIKSSDTYVKDSQNFRQFYMGLLTTNLVTYADVTNTDGLECLATLKVVTREGKKMEFAFYPYATRRCLFTLNGKGEFYVLVDAVEKMVNDAKKLITGETINYQDKD
ncbi:MAG: DUF4340 domain-containing protein [Clostridia bacterium]|nr:DUF4340 domain-containing protein [Clostridia bacterium]